MIPSAFVLTVRDVDPDFLLLEVVIGDGNFAGRAELYESTDVATTLATQLAGFPRTPADTRDVELGSSDARAAGGAVRLRLDCRDQSGHAQLSVQLLDKPRFGGANRSVECTLAVEAAAIDAFVDALGRWAPDVGDSAQCVGAA